MDKYKKTLTVMGLPENVEPVYDRFKDLTSLDIGNAQPAEMTAEISLAKRILEISVESNNSISDFLFYAAVYDICSYNGGSEETKNLLHKTTPQLT